MIYNTEIMTSMYNTGTMTYNTVIRYYDINIQYWVYDI